MAEKLAEVFISYKAEEYAEAVSIKQVLETNGISCWLAPNSIPGGSSYASEIPKAIRGCKVFVVLISKIAQESKWVPRELDQAVNANKIIMPFMLEDCELKDDFNFYLSNVQRYAAYENKSKCLKKMVSEIKALLEVDREQACVQQEPASQEPPLTEPVSPQAQEAQPQLPPQPALPKAAKVPREKGQKQKFKKVWLFATIGAVVLIAAIICFSVLSKTSIAGETIKKSTSYVELTEKTLTQKDVETLLSLKKLWHVSLKDCKLGQKQLKQILENEKLSSLTLKNCGISDESLQDISLDKSELFALDISDNAVTDLNVLEPLSDTLKKLDIRDNQVNDLEPLKDFALEELYADRNMLTSLSGLGGSLELKILSASDNKLTSLDGLQNATILQKVNLNQNTISDITYLSKSAATLRELFLAENYLKNLDELKDCTVLSTLDVHRNNLNSLSALENCEELVNLEASENKLTDTRGINSAALTYLNLSDNSLRDAQTLGKLSFTEPVQLLLHNNELEEIVLPAGKLSFLSVYGNASSTFEKIYELKCSAVIFDYFEGLDLSKAVEKGVYDYYIINCPADKQIALKASAKAGSVHYISTEQASDFLPEKPFALQSQ